MLEQIAPRVRQELVRSVYRRVHEAVEGKDYYLGFILSWIIFNHFFACYWSLNPPKDKHGKCRKYRDGEALRHFYGSVGIKSELEVIRRLMAERKKASGGIGIYLPIKRDDGKLVPKNFVVETAAPIPGQQLPVEDYFEALYELRCGVMHGADVPTTFQERKNITFACLHTKDLICFMADHMGIKL